MTEMTVHSDADPFKYHLEAERAFLGAVIKDYSQLFKSAFKPVDNCFYHPWHQVIYDAITRIGGDNTDIVAIAEEIRRQGAPDGLGAMYLIELVENCPAAQNMAYYAKLIRDHAITRKAKELIDGYHYSDPNQLDMTTIVETFKSYIVANNIDSDKFEGETPRQVMDRVVDRLKQGKPAIENVLPQDNFKNLADLAPVAKGHYAIIGALTGMGKTAFILRYLMGMMSGHLEDGSKPHGLYFYYENATDAMQLRNRS